MKIIYFLCVLLSSICNDANAERCTDGFVPTKDGCRWVSPKKIPTTRLEAVEFCKSVQVYLLQITSKLAASVTPAESKHGTDEPHCTTGFLHLENNCYWISSNQFSLTWEKAKEYCKTMNAYLLIIESKLEDRAIRAALKLSTANGYWIGGNDMQVEGKFMWMSRGAAESISYTNFHEGQPDNHRGNPNCLALGREINFLWEDADCHSKLGFICKYSP